MNCLMAGILLYSSLYPQHPVCSWSIIIWLKDAFRNYTKRFPIESQNTRQANILRTEDTVSSYCYSEICCWKAPALRFPELLSEMGQCLRSPAVDYEQWWLKIQENFFYPDTAFMSIELSVNSVTSHEKYCSLHPLGLSYQGGRVCRLLILSHSCFAPSSLLLPWHPLSTEIALLLTPSIINQ